MSGSSFSVDGKGKLPNYVQNDVILPHVTLNQLVYLSLLEKETW